MKQIIYLLLIALTFACSSDNGKTISISNTSDFERTNEIVELDYATITDLFKEGQFIIADLNGKEIPYQITYDKKLIFPVKVKAHEVINYTIKEGKPRSYETVTYAKHYPERLDDIAWENDRIAFRTYGPALQATGERAFGYDVWVKSVPQLVVEDRYYQELTNGISYHTDHGNGLDYYSVGPTLGAGTSALLSDGNIVYPYCYKTYDIIDNGPLRMTVKLTYHPLTVGDDANVIETRIISLDAGSQLNKFIVSFDNLSKQTPIVTGIVLHEPSNDYQTDVQNGFIAYADPVDPVNGQIYVGAVFPDKLEEAQAVMFSDEEKKDRKANGHVLAISNYIPGSNYTYYAGAGWSKYGFETSASWYRHVHDFSKKIKEPLEVNVH